jgi:hypothetical protein
MYKNHPDYTGARVLRDKQISATRDSVNRANADFLTFLPLSEWV